MANTSFRIEVAGDLAHAAYFVMASWRNPATAPQLETAGGPLRLLIDRSHATLGELRHALVGIAAKNELLAKSADALWIEVERQVGDLDSLELPSMLDIHDTRRSG